MKARKLIEDTTGGHGEAGGTGGQGEQLPQGWSQLSMGDVMKAMSEDDQEAVIAVLNGTRDVSEAARQLKPIFRRNAAALERLGLDPDYAAYAIPYAVFSSL